MHIAIALHKPVVVLFGSTCPQEIDLYAGGEKVVAQVDCAPCYLKRCPIGEICMNSIQVDEVFQALRRQLKVSA
jgi:heptosyltransferase-2